MKGELLPRCWGATEAIRKPLDYMWGWNWGSINSSITVYLGKVSEIKVGGVVEVERMVVG